MTFLPYLLMFVFGISLLAFICVLFPMPFDTHTERADQHDAWLNFLSRVEGDEK